MGFPFGFSNKHAKLEDGRPEIISSAPAASFTQLPSASSLSNSLMQIASASCRRKVLAQVT